ncbi:amidohydrolase family protein [Mycolicibacterium sp. F2034L]|uniref:amidohydrolase family protein n=1 Tax=Mycolicibacterium sp. F2034L TaxID=2926422 RepID=UPI001FF34414|nr:amidohydrolase family protein [Mycolicibacterium sp. F2034L]MCK0174675.1 amidohydrolase [Mycolicibacterium sp. F2034L]
MSGTRSVLLDVHTHYVDPSWYEQDGTAEATRHELIGDLDALGRLAAGDADVIRVLSAPPEILYGTLPPSDSQLRRHNEQLATIAASRSGLRAFGSVDAFSDDAAGQIAHAVDDLGLAGVVVDSGHGDAYFGDTQTWRVLEAVAERNVPLFVHPVWTADSDSVRERHGAQAAAWGRGYRNGIALLNLLDSGVAKKFPDVKIVITGLAAGSLWFAHQQIHELRDELGANPHFYIDTTSFHAPSVRYQVDVLGADRVVLGSDWPFHTDGTRDVAESVLVEAGLSDSDARNVLSANLTSLIA